MSQAATASSTVRITLRTWVALPFAVIWNAPLLLLYRYPWSTVSIVLGFFSLATALGIVVAWYCRPLRRIAYSVAGEVPDHPPLVHVSAACMMLTGLICFVLA